MANHTIALNPSQTVEQIVSLFPTARRSGSGWKIPCPSPEHRGNGDPNCYVGEGDNGGIVLCCHSKGCSYQSIATALDIPTGKRERNYVTTYQNRDGKNRNVYRDRNKRISGKGSSKGCLLLTWGEDSPDNILVIVEGEKAAKALMEHRIKGLTAVSWRGGAKVAKYADTRLVQDRNVILWPDDDSEGRKAMAEIAKLCRQSSAKGVKIIPTDGETKRDAADCDRTETLSILKTKQPIPETTTLDWLVTDRGTYQTRSVVNAEIAIQSVTKSVRFNQFTQAIELDGAPVEDADIYTLRRKVEVAHGYTPSVDAVQAGLSNLAQDYRYDPIVDWLDGLVWDKTERLYSMSTRYFGQVEDNQYVDYFNQIGALIVRGIVSRQYCPGIEFDYCPVLRSTREGTGKSRSLRILAGGADFYTGSFTLDHYDLTKATIEKSRGKLLVVSEEMAGTKRSETEKVKSIITEVQDTSRLAWGRNTSNVKRRFIFAATSNEVQILTSRTGNRRFPVLEVKEVDLQALARDRDQLFAEAVAKRTDEPVSLSEEWRAFQKQIEPNYVRESELEEWVGDTIDRIKQKLGDHPLAIKRSLFREIAKQNVKNLSDIEWQNVLRRNRFRAQWYYPTDGKRFMAWVQNGQNPILVQAHDF